MKKLWPCFVLLQISCYSILINFSMHLAMAQNNTTVSVHVGVLLDMNSLSGVLTNSCIFMAISDFYSSHGNYTTKLVLHTRDSKDDVVSAASAALGLLRNERVHAIISSTTSKQATFIAGLGDKIELPIISSTVTTPYFSNPTPYFVQTVVNDSFQGAALAEITKLFGWNEVVVIHEDTDYGTGIILDLVYNLQKSNVAVSERSVILEATDDIIENKLRELMNGQTRVFIVHMSFSLGTKIFTKANTMGMMREEYVWMITDGLASQLNFMDSSVVVSMEGVLGIKTYVPETIALKNFTARWILKIHEEHPEIERADISISSLQTYDIVWALAMAAEKVLIANISFTGGELIKEVMEFGILTSYTTGHQLLQEILNPKFVGLSGEFNSNNEQLKLPTYQIVNVVGKGDREVGFWTPTCGISRYLEDTSKGNCSISMKELRPIIWPGNLVKAPKGWVLPHVLRVGVAVKQSDFPQFLNMGMAVYSGFCIDVFKDATTLLPFSIKYDLLPIIGNDVISELILKNFDAVIEATSIQLDRSPYVDFTTSYTETGVSMIVPVIDEKNSGWIFLKPFHPELWLMTLAAFILTGVVVWLLERRVNEEFNGTPSQQVGMIFWFAFSTAVYAHNPVISVLRFGERMSSNFSKFVVIVWIFVVFVLTSSYTASLSSMLTVQKLSPTNINDLRVKGDYVGYRRGSVVLELLLNWYFDASKLGAYSSMIEYEEALSKGSANGGVTAIVDEIPFVNLFLGTYCNKFTSFGPIYNTSGFRFVFQKGSPLVPIYSEAISTLENSGKLENMMLSMTRSCEIGNDANPSSALRLGSFQNLFILTFSASLSAIIYLVYTIIPEISFGKVLLQIKTATKNWYIKDTSSENTTSTSNNGNADIELQEDGSRDVVYDTDQALSTPDVQEIR